MTSNHQHKVNASGTNNRTERYDLFLSYHWRDRAEVETVAQVLRREGLNVFLDRWYLVPGQRWQTALENALLSCRAVAVLLGPHGLGSWQQREKELALDRKAREEDFPVIPVLLPGAEPGLGFLSLNTWVDLRDNIQDSQALAIMAGAARGEAPGPELAERAQAPRTTVCPFRGLSYFREEDSEFFFGRKTFSDRLVEAIFRRPLVALVGASGCGKSSVVRAGLLPRLRRSPEGCVWEIATIAPGDRPQRALAAALLPLLEPKTTGPDTDGLERLERIKRLTAYLADEKDGLRDVVEGILEKQPGTDRLLLVVDHWEELYTLSDEGEATSFVGSLLGTTESTPLSGVLTMRSDFFGHVFAQGGLFDRLHGAVIHLGPMTREELRRAVVEPAVKVGLTYQSGLENRILGDLGDEPGSLPLLEFVLKGLWEERRGCELHHEAYDAIEGVQGAIAKRAEAVWMRLRERGSQNEGRLRRVFLDLVHSEEDAKDTRRRVELEKLGHEAKAVVAELARERLLVTGRDEATGKETVEVAHEALINRWGRLQNWLNEDREFRAWRQRLAAGFREWARTQRRDTGTLLRGAPLTEAKQWFVKRGEDLSEDERAFIRISTRTVGRRKWLLSGAAFAILLTLGLLSWFTLQYRELEADRAKHSHIEPKMVIIQPGRFIMGSFEGDRETSRTERPAHEVVFQKPFGIGRYEVTFEEYDKFVYDTSGPQPYDEAWGRGRRPVINVSWEDARDYANWLSERTGKSYRLPTEAEWEYAARSRGKKEKWAGTSNEEELGEFAWHVKNSGLKTHPVGMKKHNGLGLYDMSGNAMEWVQDCWHENYEGAPEDGSAWLEANERDCERSVIRGGSWSNRPRHLRSASRARGDPDHRHGGIVGFRLAQDL